MAWKSVHRIFCSLSVILGLILGVSLLWGQSAQAASAPLSLDLLQQRLEHPVRREGQVWIDLRSFTIDLRDEQAEFREQFYQQLRSQLQTGTSPLGLDLSDAVILGDLNLAKLGQRIPQYNDTPGLALSETAQTQLNQDFEALGQAQDTSLALVNPIQTLFRGPLNLENTSLAGRFTVQDVYFLSQVNAQAAIFAQDTNWSGARFIRSATFTAVQFQQASRFRNSIFLSNAQFNQALFAGDTTFQMADFHEVTYFTQAQFDHPANFSRSHWQRSADFNQCQFQSSVAFAKAQFDEALLLAETRFESAAIFRQARFHHPVNLRGTILYNQIDFGDAQFLEDATLNVSDLEFDSKDAQILGTPNRIGQAFTVPTLIGNETVLRNLVRNFRRLEQVADANQIEYTTQRLRLRDWQHQLTAEQYSIPNRALTVWQGLGLSLLLLLSHFGTSFGLVFGVGLIAIATFSILYWWLDQSAFASASSAKVRFLGYETICVVTCFTMLVIAGLSLIYRSGDTPTLTLVCLSLLIIPVPGTLAALFIRINRAVAGTLSTALSDTLNDSYFVQDGGARQLRLLIARLPVIPEFPFYRDRYTPLVLTRRWNWLNYFDFSLNNWLRFGFNDTRLRDYDLPGLITALVWYQWSLGVLYIALLLWTLSRTIPGLNLLLYF